jgi:uncharacterized protein (TIGR03000 family)
MYSVVLAMALAGSAEAPDCHHLCGCCGIVVSNCCGCHGVVRVGCCGCQGVVGCTGCCGGVVIYSGGVVAPPVTTPKTTPAEKVPAPKADKDKKEVSVPTAGTIVVTLPANVKLSIDGYVSQQTSAQRRLVTPAIQPGQEFTYTLVAETTQNGQPVSQSQRVTVRAGQVTPVTFSFATMPAAPRP